MSSDDSETAQASIDPYREMNRYDDRDADWPSAAVFEPPRRTLGNYWRKFHGNRGCGAGNVAFVEDTSIRSTNEKYHYRLWCWECGHRIDENEVLFIGGDWYSEHGFLEYGRSLDDLYLPPERVIELGPDPDHDDLVDALNLTRIEREVGPAMGGPLRPENWYACEECDHEVPLRFDGRCRMCYNGEWTDRLQDSVNAFERKVREWHNDSFVHRLEHHVNPLSIKDRAFEDKILWRRHANEPAPKLVEVTQCLQDDSDGHWEYILTDMTHTTYHRYHEDDLAGCFWDTGLYNDEFVKGVQDDRIRAVFQRVCDHTFTEVHDADDPSRTFERCIECRKRRRDDDE